jgi:hypothetical protein
MKREGCISLFKKLPALWQERVAGAYFPVSKTISCSSCSNALIVCIMRIAQSERGLLPLYLLDDLGILPYITNPSRARQPYAEGANAPLSLHYSIMEAINQ